MSDLRVFGFGHPARADDAVGLWVIRALQELRATAGSALWGVPESRLALAELGEPSRLVGAVSGARAVHLVDACVGEAPGRVLRWDGATLGTGAPGRVSSHGVSLLDAWRLAELIHPEPTRAWTLWAVTIGDAAGWGWQLSPAVARAAQRCAGTLASELGRALADAPASPRAVRDAAPEASAR